jgi:hypothetical protein
MNYEIEKRTLPDGWVELRFVYLRPTLTPDFKLEGGAARRAIIHLFLSGAAGVADMMSCPRISGALWQLWADVDDRLLERF